jgi:tripartite-type tricarboxylate transporter receptor subunit TctC
MNRNRSLVAIALLLPVTWIAGGAQAQDPYPTRPIQLIVPFPPGGMVDLTGRPTAAALERVLKQPVVVHNRPGAAGAVGNAAVANAKPDGYTLLMAVSSVSVLPEVDRLFERPVTYELRQLAPIALISADPTVLLVRADSPIRTLKEFLDAARVKANALSFSSSGPYGALHLPMAMLEHAAGVNLRHVPFTGGGPALNALLGGHVDALASGPAVAMPHIRAGKLRPLAVWGAKRLAALPDLPTMHESGFKIEYYIWTGVFAPAATPPHVVKVLRDGLRKAVEDPEFRAQMAKIETPVFYLDAPEFQKFWDRDAKLLHEAVRRIGKVEEEPAKK